LANELARFCIRVNAVAPGVIETDMLAKVPEKEKKKLLEGIPMARFGEPREVAEVVAFLASDAASYVTGETIRISGGL
jgi:3-oxoacyl-[acyl-carrier protein] reductase